MVILYAAIPIESKRIWEKCGVLLNCAALCRIRVNGTLVAMSLRP